MSKLRNFIEKVREIIGGGITYVILLLQTPIVMEVAKQAMACVLLGILAAILIGLFIYLWQYIAIPVILGVLLWAGISESRKKNEEQRLQKRQEDLEKEAITKKRFAHYQADNILPWFFSLVREKNFCQTFQLVRPMQPNSLQPSQPFRIENNIVYVMLRLAKEINADIDLKAFKEVLQAQINYSISRNGIPNLLPATQNLSTTVLYIDRVFDYGVEIGIDLVLRAEEYESQLAYEEYARNKLSGCNTNTDDMEF